MVGVTLTSFVSVVLTVEARFARPYALVRVFSFLFLTPPSTIEEVCSRHGMRMKPIPIETLAVQFGVTEPESIIDTYIEDVKDWHFKAMAEKINSKFGNVSVIVEYSSWTKEYDDFVKVVVYRKFARIYESASYFTNTSRC